MKKTLAFLCLTLFVFSIAAFGQVRPVENDDDDKKAITESSDSEKKIEIKKEIPKNLPKSFKVKYQGGLFGYSKKKKGEIRFDDENQRLVFYEKDGKEKFSIPYSTMLVIYPSQKKVQSGTGRVVGAALPVPGSGILGGLIKKKKNYLIIQFEDPEVDAKGNLNFLLDTEKLVTSAIDSLGQRAEMKPRGDAYIRGKDY